jgi:hypothetical protein
VLRSGTQRLERPRGAEHIRQEDQNRDPGNITSDTIQNNFLPLSG